MNKKHIDFLRKILKVDDFLVVQFVLLIPLLFFGFNYIYYSFQNPSKNSYNARFESYSGELVFFYKTQGRGRGGGGVLNRIVIEGNNGRIEFKMNLYSKYNHSQYLNYSEKRIFNLTHYNNYIVSCADNHGGVCDPQCDSPENCEYFVIQKGRRETLTGLLICLFISIFFFLAASIKVLIGGKNNV